LSVGRAECDGVLYGAGGYLRRVERPFDRGRYPSKPVTMPIMW
jgi:hypothetical protein